MGLARLVVVVVLAGVAAGLPARAADPQADERPPQDYTAVQGLSQPEHTTHRETTRVGVRDGVEISVDVVRPVTDGPWPAIVVFSPYHGTLDDRTAEGFLGPDPDGQPVALDAYFAPRGYAVLFADVRGTGRSTGCLDLLGEQDRRDAYELVEWVAAQPWSNGHVGMAGHSYPGFVAVATAGEAPPHLSTIVVNAAAGNMYAHQFQQGVPFDDMVLGPLATYQALATVGYATELAGKRPLDAACEWASSTALNTDHISGVETSWHRERDARAAAAQADIPVFAAYGTADKAVNLGAGDWFAARGGRATDKLWIGQWGHGYVAVGGESYPYGNDREEQWRGAVHAWFDRHLQGRDVETGPGVEVFLNDGRVLTAADWPVDSAATLTLHPRDAQTPSGVLSQEPGPAEVASFTPLPAEVCFTSPCPGGDPAVGFETPPASEPLLLLGTPTLHLRAAIDGPRVNIVAALYDVPPEGSPVRLHPRGFAINPELRDGLDQVTPVVPGEVMALELTGVGVAHRLLPGHRLRLEITSPGTQNSTSSHFLAAFGHGSRVDLHLGGDDPARLELPVAPGPRLWDDPRSGSHGSDDA